MHSLAFIFAMTGSASGQEQASPFTMFLPLILIFLIMWLLIFRPQARKQKMHQQMLSNVQVGDKILTIGGIYGTVKGLKKDDKVVVLEIAKDTKLEMLKSSIAQNFSAEERSQVARKK